MVYVLETTMNFLDRPYASQKIPLSCCLPIGANVGQPVGLRKGEGKAHFRAEEVDHRKRFFRCSWA